MNTNRQAGFGVIEILLIIVVIGIIAFTGWRVYEAQKEVSQIPINNSQVTSKPKEEKPAEQSYSTYTNEEYGYAFNYPKSWKTSDYDNDKGTAPGQPRASSITIESTDHKVTAEPIGETTTSGARMSVRVQATSAETIDKYLIKEPRDEWIRQTMTNQRTLTVSDVSALQYTSQYESSPQLKTVLLKNGKAYEIRMSYANDTALQAYKADYDALVTSFRLTN